MQDTERIISLIAKSSGKEVEEIERLIEAKRAKLSGLISKEGAAQIVASELGINLDKEKVKVEELSNGLKRINIVGKIINLFPIREFEKNGRKGKVANFLLADDTGSVRVVLWDTNHIKLLENREIKEGDVVEISNAGLRNGELHLGGFSDIKKSQEIIENVKSEQLTPEKTIEEFNEGTNAKTRAIIVQVFEPKFFDVCPECGKRIIIEGEKNKCETHGIIVPEKRVLLSIVIDDGTSNIRALLFQEQIEKLGLNKEDLEPENFIEKRQSLLGKEAYFIGRVRRNKMFNNLEFLISDIQEVNIEKLIETLEK